MKNETNIYDIDGNLLREAGNNEKLTIDEAQKRIEEYKKKIDELGENDPKADVYNTYIVNLSRYILSEYAKTPHNEISKIAIQDTPENAVEKALSELNEDINTEEQPVLSQEDMLVERDTEAPVMDEYVDFEEIKE